MMQPTTKSIRLMSNRIVILLSVIDVMLAISWSGSLCSASTRPRTVPVPTIIIVLPSVTDVFIRASISFL